ncbi:MULTISPECIES: exodeoxyribonuclease VII large subunit [unclassified Xanthobacter]|uniref:exodeoxyribonuclease VII large subunit n=1 Tax=unclassified Xanthobacter TaxID=2623496 RepID=UPI001F457981|nr:MULTISPECIES: exodeoxyribonuclease VII large subunit [unclassified Xanthobacter]
MADLPESRGNAPEWSVSELSAALRRTVEDAYGHVRVRGEISGYRGPHSSGHAYFSLKDAGARLDAVIWKGTFQRLKLRPEEGLEVVAIGRLTTYPGKSGYQIIIESLEFAGAGAIMAMLEERKRRLATEGLFDPARKQELPYLPQVIGVVTSPTGAVIRDILHRLADRFPRRVVVWPVRVQGETCGAEVAAAIRGFNALPEGGPIPRPDVIVVARGGGSLEDLLGFSEEAVVRAAADSFIPLVSAVGHETDVTLIDFASDVRAPTPTAAAEMVVPVRSDLVAAVEGLGARLASAPLRMLERRRADLRGLTRLLPTAEDLFAIPRQRLDAVGDRLPLALKANAAAHRLRLLQAGARLSPLTLRARFERVGERVDGLSGRLSRAAGMTLRQAQERLRSSGQSFALARGAHLRAQRELNARRAEWVAAFGLRASRAMAGRLRDDRRRLDGLAQLLSALSYHGVLERGFALVRDAEGRAVRRAGGLGPGAVIEIEFADGRVGAQTSGASAHAGVSPVADVGAADPVPSPRRAPVRRKKPDPGPTLFD